MKIAYIVESMGWSFYPILFFALVSHGALVARFLGKVSERQRFFLAALGSIGALATGLVGFAASTYITLHATADLTLTYLFGRFDELLFIVTVALLTALLPTVDLLLAIGQLPRR